jgi:hypothetical protein
VSFRTIVYLSVPPTENLQAQTVPRVVTATYTSKEFRELASFQRAKFYVNVSAISGVGAQVQVDVQAQDPVSLNWVSLSILGASPGTVINATGETTAVAELYDTNYRVVYTVAGTTPSISMTCVAVVNTEEPIT